MFIIRKAALAIAATAAVGGLVLAGAGAAGAGVSGSRATNANVNPVAGYLAVGNDVNVNFDHVEAYLGAQDNIGDLSQSVANGFGIGLCNSNVGGTTGPALEIGLVKQTDGNYQVEYGDGTVSAATGSSTSGDNCEDGILGTFSTSDVHSTFGAATSPEFAFGNVEEVEIQYLHGDANFSFRQITSDNPGPWFSTGWISTGFGSGTKFNEAQIGVEADTTGLVGPVSRTLAPFAHASVTSETFAMRHRHDQGWFDKAPNGEWTAIPVSSYPNGNTADSAVLAPNGLHNGNGGIGEGAPVG